MDDNDRLRAGVLPRDPLEGTVRVLPPAEDKPVPLVRVGELLDEALRRAEARRTGAEKPVPLPWLATLPQFGGGLWPGVHVLVSGTGVGKTSWALQVALHAAKKGTPVGYVGLELEGMQIALRLLAEQAGVKWSPLYLGDVEANVIEKVHAAKAALAELPFYVELGRPNGWPISELGGFIEKMRAAHPEPTPGAAPMLLVLDFLQIVGDEVQANGRPMGLDLRERIGRAAYFARDAARRHNVAVLLVSSAARDKYGVLSGDVKDAGLGADIDADDDAKPRDRKPKVTRRYIARPDVLVGLGKESGEIEFSADSVTAAVRVEPLLGDKRTPVIFATSKGRATGASWCELRFDGFRFEEPADGGLALATRIKSESESASKSKAKQTNVQSVSLASKEVPDDFTG